MHTKEYTNSGGVQQTPWWLSIEHKSSLSTYIVSANLNICRSKMYAMLRQAIWQFSDFATNCCQQQQKDYAFVEITKNLHLGNIRVQNANSELWPRSICHKVHLRNSTMCVIVRQPMFGNDHHRTAGERGIFPAVYQYDTRWFTIPTFVPLLLFADIIVSTVLFLLS